MLQAPMFDGLAFDVGPLAQDVGGSAEVGVHHITEADFTDDTPVCTLERLRLAVWGGETPDVLVAHNCEFERQFITEAATDRLPWICTYKAALRVWPEAPRHTNQVLRYWRGLNLDLELAMPPHRAGPDA